MSFAAKVVIVTGASSGIGASIAIKFCDEGANVSLVGRNQDKLKGVLDTCQKTSGTPHVIAADVTKEADAKRIVEETLKYFGKLDVLINNAGIGGRSSILDENFMKKFDEVMSVNLRSVARLTNLCAKHLVETKGNIVNISSVMSMAVSPSAISYCSAKAALDHFTRCVARELAPKGVRVNTVNPGPVKTDIVENAGLTGAEAAVRWESMRKSTALGRTADPEEIAELVLFLVSDKATSITGSSLLSDNGCLLGNRQPQN